MDWVSGGRSGDRCLSVAARNPILLTFIVIGSGYLVGRIKIGTIEVGSTTGVLLAGLLFGHLGFPNQPAATRKRRARVPTY